MVVGNSVFNSCNAKLGCLSLCVQFQFQLHVNNLLTIIILINNILTIIILINNLLTIIILVNNLLTIIILINNLLTIIILIFIMLLLLLSSVTFYKVPFPPSWVVKEMLPTHQ